MSFTKTKQKSILDYFNKSNDNNKRSGHHLGINQLNNKFLKTNDNEISIVSQNKPIDCTDIEDKCSDVLKDVSSEEFIDLNHFLQIDFIEEDVIQENNKQMNDNCEELSTRPSNDENYMSFVYQRFRQMIDFVLSDNSFEHLFDSNDTNIIQCFTCLSGLAQMLFMRLFMRKRSWIRKNAIKYPEIADNLWPFLKELVENQFLLDVTNLSDLSESMDILDTLEMKRIGKSLKGLNMNGLNTKKNIKSAVIKYLNTCQPVFQSDKTADEMLFKCIKSILKDKCFKVNEKLCEPFEHMFLLFIQPEIDDEDINTRFNYEFFRQLKIETDGNNYPKYNINKSSIIYTNRNDLFQYCQSFKLEIELLNAIEKKDFNEVIDVLLPKIEEIYRNEIKEKIDKNDITLSSFLRRFTAGQTYIRCLSHCVSVLEQKKDYIKAVYILKEILLNQLTYCTDSRGRWFERLTLNLHKHLKDTTTALKMIEMGLNDDNVRTGHRLALNIRRQNIEKSVKTNLAIVIDVEFENIKYNETTIYAETLKYVINDRKNIFKTTDSNGDVTVMSVEDIVINHYKNNGYPNGIHTESRIYHTIFGLLFWDIIYTSDSPGVSDAFRFRYQRLPLDFNSDQFFLRRKPQILSLLSTLKNMNEMQINNILENSWNSNFGTISLINWENTDINQIKEILMCFGVSIITDICERLIKDFRHTRSGFPDLLVWNPLTRQIKAVEVKSPNDRPSNKQKLWLNFLQSIGADVEICHVKANKKLVANNT